MQRHLHLRSQPLTSASSVDAEAVFLWMAALAHADQKLCREEDQHLLRVARDLRIPADRRQALVRMSRQKGFEPPHPSDPTERSAWFRLLARLTLKDGAFCHREESILRRFQECTQLGPGEYTDALEGLRIENQSIRRRRFQMAAGMIISLSLLAFVVLRTSRRDDRLPRQVEWPLHISELDQGVFFIQTNYSVRLPDREKPLQRQGVGTAFLATDRGHLLTGKHVVKPWLYSTEIADLMQNHGASIHDEDVDISIWRTGASEHEPSFASLRKRDLQLLRIGADDSVPQDVTLRGKKVNLRIHRPSPQDYAVLYSPRLLSRKPLPLGPRACDLNAYHPVGVMGYPGGRIFDPEKRLRPAIQAGHFTRRGSLIEVDLKAMGGVSGSPMFDRQTGRVLGIVASRASNDAFCRCVPISNLIDCLEDL